MAATTNQYQAKIAHLTATIASSATESTAIDLSGTTLCGIYTPAAITGTSFTFQGSQSLGGTYVTITNNAGANISAAVAANRYVALSPSDFAGIRFLKIISSASEAATRDIIIAARSV